MIYHIVLASSFRAQLQGTAYQPSSLAEEGFVHCSLEHSVIPVANNYYARASEQLLLLEIDPERLASETRYEAAAPIDEGDSAHLASASLFPHVYGPIDRGAIMGVGLLARSAGGFSWPGSFIPLDSFLEVTS